MKLMKDRKKYLKEYQELFAVLLKFPDKGVQIRILNAINETNFCICGKNQFKPKLEKANISTQTEGSLPFKLDQNSDDIKLPEDELSKNNVSLSNVEEKIKAIRKRKRKYKVPLVIKRTEEEMKKTPAHRQESLDSMTNSNLHRPKRERKLTTDSFLNEAIIDHQNFIVKPREELTVDDVLQKMKSEYENCLKFENHLLPIHKYIQSNNFFGLQRQIYVIKKRNINFDNIVTEDDQTLMQIAVQSNSSFEILNELIKEDNHTNVIDEQSNNLLHLAVKFYHNDNVDKFKLLLESLDLDLLSKHNDDGFTPLHLAVRTSQFKFVHLILDTINKKTKLEDFTSQPKDELKTEEDYLNFYKKLLMSTSSIKEKNMRLNDQKKHIINQQDIKHGRTALYFAIDMKAELLINMLIVHLANPNIVDYSGSDVQSFFAEINSCTGINKHICAKLLDLSIFYKKANKLK